MTPNAPQQDFLSALTDFAQGEIAPQADALCAAHAPDYDPAAVGIPSLPDDRTDGLDHTHLIARAGYLLNRYGGAAGVTMSILGRWLTRDLVAPYADLPSDATLALAISEPGAGAHPKHMRAIATEQAGRFVLDGEKVFVTNGLSATHFLVIAISGVENGRNQFSAYVVKPDDPGVTLTRFDKVTALHPCSHAALTLNDCIIPKDRQIGPKGGAMQAFSGPVRATEDRIFAQANLGLMRHICDLLAPTLPEDAAEPLGRCLVRIAAQEQLSLRLLEQDTDDDAFLGTLSFAQAIRADIAVLEQTAPDIPPTAARCLRDLDTLLSIASNVRRMQVTRLGQILMTQET